MAKRIIRITHISWRDGRPRFQPSKQLRAEGWKGEDLRHGPEETRPEYPSRRIGPWFNEAEAFAWVKEREKDIAARRQEIAAARAARRRIPAAPGTTPVRWYSIEDLFEGWRKSPRMAGGKTIGKQTVKAVAASTLADYRVKEKVLAHFDPELFASPVDALTGPIVYDLYERLWQAKGLATARGVIAVLSAAISWGMRKGTVKLATNPCKGLGMQTPEARVRAGTPAEIHALIAAADRVGRPEIGDAIALGVWTGQRQGDRLALIDGGVIDGRRVFRQSKTKAVVMIPDAPDLAARLAASRARRKDWTVQPLEIVLDEKQKAPFRREHYSNTFAVVRAAAVAGATDARTSEVLAPGMASLADFRDQDLRDTAVTWLARAGCTLAEICQITGHSMQSAQQTLKHYLASHPELADNAIKKLVAWMDGQTS